MIRLAPRCSKANTIFPPSPPPTIATQPAESKVRTVFASVLERSGDRVIYRIRGSGFLKHMVRNIVGTLLQAGRGNVPDLSALPARSGPTAPAQGLFMVRAEY